MQIQWAAAVLQVVAEVIDYCFTTRAASLRQSRCVLVCVAHARVLHSIPRDSGKNVTLHSTPDAVFSRRRENVPHEPRGTLTEVLRDTT